jgi:hypothetical protein
MTIVMTQAVQSGTVGRIRPKYAHRVRPIDPTHAAERRARIEQMIEEYREATQRRLLQRAKTLWLNAEADQRLLAFEAQEERVH